MSTKVVNKGDSSVRKPGTCKQTGNTAPQFPWAASPLGRFARVFAHCVANHLGYTDDYMAKNHKFPSKYDFGYFFHKWIPWFEIHYNQTRRLIAQEKGYTGKLESFNGSDAENRVRYEFAKPGKKGQPRQYGVSVENYLSTTQQSSNGRMEVWTRCSEKIFERLQRAEPITQEEALEWGE